MGQVKGANTYKIPQATLNQWDAAYAHIFESGASHSFIDQTVVVGSAPSFLGTNFTSIPLSAITGISTSYLAIDGSNANVNINIDTYNFTTTGDIRGDRAIASTEVVTPLLRANVTDLVIEGQTNSDVIIILDEFGVDQQFQIKGSVGGLINAYIDAVGFALLQKLIVGSLSPNRPVYSNPISELVTTRPPLLGDGDGIYWKLGTNVLEPITAGNDILTAGNIDGAVVTATGNVDTPYIINGGGNFSILSSAGTDITVRLGDTAAANKISFTRSNNSEIASINSIGATFLYDSLIVGLGSSSVTTATNVLLAQGKSEASQFTGFNVNCIANPTSASTDIYSGIGGFLTVNTGNSNIQGVKGVASSTSAFANGFASGLNGMFFAPSAGASTVVDCAGISVAGVVAISSTATATGNVWGIYCVPYAGLKLGIWLGGLITPNLFGMEITDAAGGATHAIDNQYGLVIRKPTMATVAADNRQLVIDDSGVGSGVFFGTAGAATYTPQARIYSDGTDIIIDANDAAATGGSVQVKGQLALENYTFPIADGASDEMLITDGAGTATWQTLALPPQLMEISMYDALPERASESNWNGGLKLLTAGTEASPTATQLGPATPANDISVSKGIGKIMVVVVAGSDVAGTITVTGETIDRNTGASTPADTNTITVDAVTTDASATDANGNRVHDFTGAYITDDWFTGTVVLSTSTLNCTVYVYHVSFEQLNDTPGITLKTFDANIYTTGTLAEFDAYLYTLHKEAVNKCDLHSEADLHVGALGETAITDRYWRLRRGNIDHALDGTTDGFWCDITYVNSPVQVEDVTLRVWFTVDQSITLT